MIKQEMTITRFLLDVETSWLTMPVFIGALVGVAFVAAAILLWNAVITGDDDDDHHDQ